MTATRNDTRFVSVAPKLGFVGPFDGFRGVGVLVAMWIHAVPHSIESWGAVVDMFFMLSAFLIVTLLLQESRTNGTINLKKFFIRRAVRLLPSVWLFCSIWLVIGAVGQALGIKGVRFIEIAKDVGAAVTYLYHVIFPTGLFILHPTAQNHRVMWHLWTLGVEEHFYLIIAPLVIVCVARRWIKQLGVLMGILFVTIGVMRWMAFTGPVMSPSAIPGVRLAFIQRPDVLMLGVLLAVLNAHFTVEKAERWRKPLTAIGSVAFGAWLIINSLSCEWLQKLGLPYVPFLPQHSDPFTRHQMLRHMYWFRFGHTLGAIAFACVTICLVRYSDWWLSRLMSWQPARWTGRMSYTLYIWHALPYLILIKLTGEGYPNVSHAFEVIRVPFLFAVTFAIAIPVFYKVEQPALALKNRFATDKDSLDLRTAGTKRKKGEGGSPGANE